jgi:raffinose/stachyose/melibiose transport system permease protein
MAIKRSLHYQVFCYIVLFLVMVLYLVPLYFALNVSLKTSREFIQNSVGLTKSWAFGNYATAWQRASLGNYILNSVLYTSVCTVLSLTLSLFVAFPIARKYIPFSNVWYYLFVCGLFLPNGMIPLFQIILRTGLYNTQPGYMLVMTGVNATSVFFFTGFLKSIPRDMDDAAAIDGCSYFKYMINCVIPLSKTALTSMGILTMIGVWNDIISSTIYLTDAKIYNITRGLFAFTGQYQNNWTLMAAAMFIVASPLIASYIAGQRFIVSGIMAGGLKA